MQLFDPAAPASYLSHLWSKKNPGRSPRIDEIITGLINVNSERVRIKEAASGKAYVENIVR